MRDLRGSRFCPLCGGPLATRVPPGDHRARLLCPACGFILYLGPKVAAGVVAERDGKVAIIRRGVPPGLGLWSFPCGFAEVDETLEQCAVRETREETGLEVALRGLVGVWSDAGDATRPFGVAVVVYAGEVVGGRATAGDDAAEIRWVGPGDVPWDDLAFESSRGALRAWVAGRPGTPVRG